MTLEDFIKENISCIVELKKKYSNIFSVETIDGFFVFRPMTKGEFSCQGDYNILGEAEVEEEIFKKYVLLSSKEYSDLDELHSGTITVLAREIISISGFGSESTFISILEKAREDMDIAENQIIGLIIKAFPNLSLKDIDNFDIQQLTYMLALAEKILGANLTIQEKSKETKNTNSPIDFKKENQQIMGFEGGGDKPFAW